MSCTFKSAFAALFLTTALAPAALAQAPGEPGSVSRVAERNYCGRIAHEPPRAKWSEQESLVNGAPSAG